MFTRAIAFNGSLCGLMLLATPLSAQLWQNSNGPYMFPVNDIVPSQDGSQLYVCRGSFGAVKLVKN
jgi:hypothetical protein